MDSQVIIKVKPEDQYKIAFITPWDTFCWVIMPFVWKNVGATYQRALVSMFHDMVHECIEIYVDDILAKSIIKYNHIADLRKIFQWMREYKLKIKSQKYAFGVSSKKLLGFIIS